MLTLTIIFENPSNAIIKMFNLFIYLYWFNIMTRVSNPIYNHNSNMLF